MNRRSATSQHIRDEAVRLYLSGQSQPQIAATLRVSQQAISAAIRGVMQDSQERMHQSVDAHRVEQLARIHWSMAELADAWFASKAAKETTETEANEVAGQTFRKAKMRKEAQTGNPAYMAGYQKALDQKAELLGLNAPKVVKIDWDTVTESQLLRLAAGEAPEAVMAQA